MITYAAIVGTLITAFALLMHPQLGVTVALVVRSIVDATWDDPVIGNLRLTEVLSVIVPTLVIAHMFVARRGERRFVRVPFSALWMTYCFDICVFSSLFFVKEGPLTAANVFFRHMSGPVGYYMGQAFFRTHPQTRRFFWALVVAGVFPLVVGIYQAVSGTQWKYADTEGIGRSIGLYHDAFTVRYYMLQLLLAGVILLSTKAVESRLVRGVIVLMLLLALVVMFRAYSKSAVVTIVIWVITWTVLRRQFALQTALGAVVCAGVVLYLPEVIEQIQQMFHKEVGAIQGSVKIERTLAGRWYDWIIMYAAWERLEFFDKMFGSGTLALGAHNDYLMMLWHGGVVGLCIYTAIVSCTVLACLRNAITRRDAIALSGLMAVTMWCVDSLGLVPSAYPGYQWFVWGVIGIGLRRQRDEQTSLLHRAAP